MLALVNCTLRVPVHDVKPLAVTAVSEHASVLVRFATRRQADFAASVKASISTSITASMRGTLR